MSKIRRAAKGQPCTLRLLGCDAGPENETTVLAHAPSASKGMGIKSEDWFSAFSCFNCHQLADRREYGPVMEKEILQAWLRGIHETHVALIAMGLIKVE